MKVLCTEFFWTLEQVIKIWLFLAGHTVAVVTYGATNMKTTGSQMFGQVFDINVALSVEEWF